MEANLDDGGSKWVLRMARPLMAAAAFALVATLLALYVYGYLSQGSRMEWEVPDDLLSETRGHRTVVSRFYGTETMAIFFKPAAFVESWLIGRPVTSEAVTY